MRFSVVGRNRKKKCQVSPCPSIRLFRKDLCVIIPRLELGKATFKVSCSIFLFCCVISASVLMLVCVIVWYVLLFEITRSGTPYIEIFLVKLSSRDDEKSSPFIIHARGKKTTPAHLQLGTTDFQDVRA